MPVIVAIWEAKISNIKVRDQLGKRVFETPFQWTKARHCGMHLSSY
jgi:hypothetical protein